MFVVSGLNNIQWNLEKIGVVVSGFVGFFTILGVFVAIFQSNDNTDQIKRLSAIVTALETSNRKQDEKIDKLAGIQEELREARLHTEAISIESARPNLFVEEVITDITDKVYLKNTGKGVAHIQKVFAYKNGQYVLDPLDVRIEAGGESEIIIIPKNIFQQANSEETSKEISGLSHTIVEFTDFLNKIYYCTISKYGNFIYAPSTGNLRPSELENPANYYEIIHKPLSE